METKAFHWLNWKPRFETKAFSDYKYAKLIFVIYFFIFII